MTLRRKLMVLSITFSLVLGGLGMIVLSTETGLNWVFGWLARSVPGTLTVQSLNGTLLGPIELINVSYREQAMEVDLDRVHLQWRLGSIMGGVLHVESVMVEGLRLNELENGAPVDDKPGTPSWTLPLDIKVDRVKLEAVVLSPKFPVIDRFETSIHVTERQIRLASLFVQSGNFQTKGSGRLELTHDVPFDLGLQWNWNDAEWGEFEGQSQLIGNRAHIELEQKVSGSVHLQMNATIDKPFGEPQWEGKIELFHADAGMKFPNLKGVQISGNIAGRGGFSQFNVDGDLNLAQTPWDKLETKFVLEMDSEQLTLPSINVSQLSTGASISGIGYWKFKPSSDQIGFTVNWQGLCSPPSVATRLCSPSGQGSVQGNPDRFDFNVNTQFQEQAWPSVSIQVQGQGNQNSVTIGHMESEILNGQLGGHGRLSWKHGMHWDFSLTARDIDPGVHWLGWDGLVNARAQLKGDYGAQQSTVHLELLDVSGKFRQQAFTGAGAVEWNGRELLLEQIRVNSKQANARVSGRLGESVDLAWHIEAEQLQNVLPLAGGNLFFKGTMTGPRHLPRLDAQLRGQSLAWGNSFAKDLKGTAIIDNGDPGLFQAQIDAVDLQLNGRQWSRFEARIDGAPASHELHARLVGADEGVELALKGEMVHGSLWQGDLKKASLNIQPWGVWQLSEPASLSLGSNGLNLGHACWIQTEGRLCVQGSRKQDQWSARAQAHAVTLNPLQQWLGIGLQLDGRFDAWLNLDYGKDRLLSGDGELKVPVSRVRFGVGESEKQVSFHNTVVRALVGSEGLRAEFKSQLEPKGEINGKLHLPVWELAKALDRNQPVKGQIHTELQSIGLFGYFIPEVENLQGNVKADMEVVGTLTHPQAIGRLRLRDGSFDVPQLAIVLKDFTFTLDGGEDDGLNYSAKARSGDGMLQLTGHSLFDTKQGWVSDMSISGQDFLISNLPAAIVSITPALKIKLKGRQLNLDGEIVIPGGKLNPGQPTKDMVPISRDVVIVAPETDGTTVSQTDWRVTSRVRLIVGDRVYFDGFGLRGRLNGDVFLLDEPGRPTRGRGELAVVEGVYQAYGQSLNMRHGRLVFADTLIDDPGLDLSAERKVGEVLAGVLVSGTLRQPVIQLYSEPTMDDSNILSYMILGRPISAVSKSEGAVLLAAASAMGLVRGEGITGRIGSTLGLDEIRLEWGESDEQTALVLGRYLSPKLYVRYIAGVVEPSNIVQLRYKFSKHVEVQTETGTRSGADIFYTIDR